jgi:hypothetical protein
MWWMIIEGVTFAFGVAENIRPSSQQVLFGEKRHLAFKIIFSA